MCVGVISLDKVSGEASLAKVHRDHIVLTRPLEMGTQEPVDSPHEIDGDEAGEELFEPAFDLRIF